VQPARKGAVDDRRHHHALHIHGVGEGVPLEAPSLDSPPRLRHERQPVRKRRVRGVFEHRLQIAHLQPTP